MEKKSKPKPLRNFVGSKIEPLIEREDDAYLRASLAKLRRGIGKKPGSVPEIWEFTLNGLPEDYRSKSGEPTRQEWAVHMVMTMFALHQQGKKPCDYPMHVVGGTLGSAMRTLVYKRETSAAGAAVKPESVNYDKNPLKRRFDAVITSSSAEELAHHLRGLVQLLRSEGVPLDYQQLAEDLFAFQFLESRDNVRLKWGRDYFKIGKEDKDNDQ